MSAATPDTAAEPRANGARPRVLVKEKIGDSGVALLREHFDVELGFDWDDEQLAERIGDYDGHRDPLGDEADRRADRARRRACA